MLFGSLIMTKLKKKFLESFNVPENRHLVVKQMHFSNMNISTISNWISIIFSSNVCKHIIKRFEEKYLNILTFLKQSLFLFFRNL